MLRITIRDDAASGEGLICLLLEGRISGPWVSELGRVWEVTHIRSSVETRIQVDLSFITYVSRAGGALLRQMISEGAQLIARDPLTKADIEGQVAVQLLPGYNVRSSGGSSMRGRNAVKKNQREHSSDGKPARPSYEEIAVRAYEIWMESGYSDGKQEQHWHEAEKDLLAKSDQRVTE